MSLSKYVHAMGRGPSRGRSLTRAEAADAMTKVLTGSAAPEAVGALLMMMRYRGETADEVAGFIDAAQCVSRTWAAVPAGLDWPSYATGRPRGLPWILLPALLVAQSGRRALLHGWNSHQNKVSDVRSAAQALEIAVAATPDSATAAIGQCGIAYVPWEGVNPALLWTLRLRDVPGLRSAVNTVCRMLNPSKAAATVQGVFHPFYRALQQDAGHLLGQANLMVIKGGGGEFERHPAKICAVFGLRNGTAFETLVDPSVQDHRRLAEQDSDLGHLVSVWRGDAMDAWAEAIVVGTTALALQALDAAEDDHAAMAQSQRLWRARHTKMAA